MIIDAIAVVIIGKIMVYLNELKKKAR